VSRRGHDRGAGLFSAAFGLVIFLAFLMLAVQVLVSLYATSVVTGAAYDAGRYAARTGDAGAAQARFARSVGGADVAASISIVNGTNGPDQVIVTISGKAPTFLAGRFAADLPFGTIDRTIRIRGESFRE
jgi:Flp pilus assembly protein TadG